MTRALLAVPFALAAGLAQAAPMLPTPEPAPPLVLRVFDERITETRDLPTWALQQARRRMLAGETISWDDMRGLADAGDGLAAFRLGQRIEARVEEGGDPALLGDAAFYYAVSAYTNRDYAVPPLLRLLRRGDLEFSPRRLEHLENALRAMALSGDARASRALMDFYASGQPFGPQPERALEFRLDLAEEGDAEAASQLVLEALGGSLPVALDEGQVARLLDVVDASGDFGLRTMGANLRRMLDAGRIAVRAGAAPDADDEPIDAGAAPGDAAPPAAPSPEEPA